MHDRVWVVLYGVDYEGEEIKGVYRRPDLAKSAAIEMLLAHHRIASAPRMHVVDIKLGHFRWESVGYGGYWRVTSHEVKDG